jgi:hypothetical protein
LLISGGVAWLGGVAAFCGRVGAEERRERLCGLVGRDGGSGVVCVDVEPCEEGLVEDAAGACAGEPV